MKNHINHKFSLSILMSFILSTVVSRLIPEKYENKIDKFEVSRNFFYVNVKVYE